MKIKQLACLALAFFLSNALAAQVASTSESLTTANVLAFDQSESEYKEVQKELRNLEKQRKDLLDRMEALDEQQKALVSRIEKLESVYDGAASAIPTKSSGKRNSSFPAVAATTQIKEMQMSFNLQYLQLQSQMQHENRSYTAISNIMKTKHDTVKNSIGNIR